MVHAFLEIFLWLIGLCVGSFLNVVVYRLSVGLSITNPVRSFCPNCQAGIAWYDNVPVLSWVLLRARCRHCHEPISVQYPLVEALTGLAFVLVYHLLFVVGARDGMGPAGIPGDVPLLLAWLLLVAALIACSAMDLVSYSVDVRITNVAVVGGLILHAVWPRPGFFVSTAQTPLAAAAVAALLVGGLAWLFREWRGTAADAGAGDEEGFEFDAGPESRMTRIVGRFGTAAFVGLALWLIMLALAPQWLPGAGTSTPILIALLAAFFVTAVLGGQPRAADDEIQAAVENERPLARRRAGRELAELLVPVGAGVLAALLVTKNPAAAAMWQAVVNWSPGAGLAPAGGAAFAIHGAMLAAAAGWFLRVVFTLIYGREAFGVGDIYLLAAAGATAGWDIALLGLVLAVGIALAGWGVGLVLKTTIMIPFGPWLALGFVAALGLDHWAHRLAENYAHGLAFAWRERPELLAITGGLMLVGCAAAIVLTRMLRRWIVKE